MLCLCLSQRKYPQTHSRSTPSPGSCSRIYLLPRLAPHLHAPSVNNIAQVGVRVRGLQAPGKDQPLRGTQQQTMSGNDGMTLPGQTGQQAYPPQYSASKYQPQQQGAAYQPVEEASVSPAKVVTRAVLASPTTAESSLTAALKQQHTDDFPPAKPSGFFDVLFPVSHRDNPDRPQNSPPRIWGKMPRLFPHRMSGTKNPEGTEPKHFPNQNSTSHWHTNSPALNSVPHSPPHNFTTRFRFEPLV